MYVNKNAFARVSDFADAHSLDPPGRPSEARNGKGVLAGEVKRQRQKKTGSIPFPFPSNEA